MQESLIDANRAAFTRKTDYPAGSSEHRASRFSNLLEVGTRDARSFSSLIDSRAGQALAVITFRQWSPVAGIAFPASTW